MFYDTMASEVEPNTLEVSDLGFKPRHLINRLTVP